MAAIKVNNFWRPAYEAWSGTVWMLMAGSLYIAVQFQPPAFEFLGYVVAVMGFVGFLRIKQAWALWSHKADLCQLRPLPMKPQQILRKVRGIRGKYKKVWLGRGFTWGRAQAQKLRDVAALDEEDLRAPRWFLAWRYLIGRAMRRDIHGRAYFFGIGVRKAHDITMDSDDLGSHVGILGTTGAGKSTVFSAIFITQAIHRGDCVLITDPKGDQGMLDRAYAECVKAGKKDTFYYFHPAFPAQSARINLLANYASPNQLGERIASLMPGGGDAEGFRKYAWTVVNNVVLGLLQAGETPNLVKIRTYVVGGVEGLLIRAAERYFSEVSDQFPSWESEVAREANRIEKRSRSDSQAARAKALITYYERNVRGIASSEALDGLVSIYLHDAQHHGKMIATLEPILTALTSGKLRELLSPDYDDPFDPRPIIDLDRVIRKGGCVYMALDSLSDSTVGSLIGALMLSDMTAVMGSRYNFEETNERKVTVLTDEINQVISEPYIQALSKGRGAGARLAFATQAMADLEVRFGSSAQAMQVLGNINTVFGMRSHDPDTQKYLAETLGKTRISTVSMSHSTSSRTDDSDIDFGRNTGAKFSMKDGEYLVEPAMFSRIPDLQMFGRLHDGRVVLLRVPYMPVEPELRFPRRNYA